MPKLQVFDQPMCCSSGVCGPDVDPALIAFATNLQWLEAQGVQVQRINPAHQPEEFAASEIVRKELQERGNKCLPLIVVDDDVVSRGAFPSRNQLANWSGISSTSDLSLPVVNTDCCDEPASGDGPSPCC